MTNIPDSFDFGLGWVYCDLCPPLVNDGAESHKHTKCQLLGVCVCVVCVVCVSRPTQALPSVPPYWLLQPLWCCHGPVDGRSPSQLDCKQFAESLW